MNSNSKIMSGGKALALVAFLSLWIGVFVAAIYAVFTTGVGP